MVLHSQGKALWSALTDCTHMVPLKRELHQDEAKLIYEMEQSHEIQNELQIVYFLISRASSQCEENTRYTSMGREWTSKRSI